MNNRQATETLNLEQSRMLQDISARRAAIVMGRLANRLPAGQLRILELGSAQGLVLIGLARKGYEVHGIDPCISAINIAKQLIYEEKLEIDVREGRAEAIPYQSNRFHLVLAFSVMEHVENLTAALNEVYRVLKPGGIFWFYSESSLCPQQNEIQGFPLFGWYPDSIKLKIMAWAKKNKPDLIGCTEHPAINWWTPWNARTRLKSAGFGEVYDRWDLFLPDEFSGYHYWVYSLAKRNRIFRFLADMVIPGCSYAAVKYSLR
jgi:SAM-dependent methyltransferase